MDPFTLLGWAASGISLTGSVLNARMNIHGYTLWLCSNAIWMVYDVSLGLWEQLPMFAVSTVLAAYGIAEWRKRQPSKGPIVNSGAVEDQRINTEAEP